MTKTVPGIHQNIVRQNLEVAKAMCCPGIIAIRGIVQAIRNKCEYLQPRQGIDACQQLVRIVMIMRRRRCGQPDQRGQLGDLIVAHHVLQPDKIFTVAGQYTEVIIARGAAAYIAGPQLLCKQHSCQQQKKSW